MKTTCSGNNGNFVMPPAPAAYTEISYPGMNQTEVPVISGIAVDPNNPNILWISMVGYDNIDIRVAKSIDGGVHWG
jgi:hypothetical protein